MHDRAILVIVKTIVVPKAINRFFVRSEWQDPPDTVRTMRHGYASTVTFSMGTQHSLDCIKCLSLSLSLSSSLHLFHPPSLPPSLSYTHTHTFSPSHTCQARWKQGTGQVASLRLCVCVCVITESVNVKERVCVSVRERKRVREAPARHGGDKVRAKLNRRRPSPNLKHASSVRFNLRILVYLVIHDSG